MIRKALRILFPFIILLHISCSEEEISSANNNHAKVIVPEAGKGILLSSEPRNDAKQEAMPEMPAPKAKLPDSYNVLNVIDDNLDLDQADEQLITLKLREDPLDTIHILVLDYDEVRQSYILSWEGETKATNIRTFTIYLMDLIGNHEKEIVCFGMDAEGGQTLDAFKKTHSPVGFGLYYKKIVSLVADGSIEIREKERAEAYQALQSPGPSFPIVVNTRDKNSENLLDLIKTTYYWRYDEDSYVKGNIEQIPGIKIEEEQLSEIIGGDEEVFEDFLTGPWYRASGNDEGGESVDIIYFDPEKRNIALFSGDVQESYIWTSSYKTISQSLYITMNNESIEMIRENVSISVAGLDTILLRIRGNDEWNGTYRRLTKHLQSTMMENNRKSVELVDFNLHGTYKNEAGLSINFSYPNFTMKEEGQKISGGYAVYQLNDYVLELMVISENGLVEERRRYQLEYSEEDYPERILRIITLIPAELSSSGIIPLEGPPLRIEQIEQKE